MTNEFDFTQEMDLNQLIPNGEYEAFIELAEEKALPSGSRVINLTWKIRDDVEQACKGRKVFDTIWPDREDNTKWDRVKMYNIIHNGQDLNDKNTRTSFDTLEDFIQYLNGINMRISVQSYTNTRTGETFNEIKRYGGYMPTKAKPQTLGSSTISASSPLENPIKKDDLPF